MRKMTIAFLFFLAGCNFRPCYDYDITMPSTWRTETCEGSDVANIRWWEQFNDPILDQLIVLALQNNYDLKVTAARVSEYYAQYGQEKSKSFPLVSAMAGVDRVGDWVPYPGGPVVSGSLYTFVAALSYEIDVWGKIRNLNDAALDKYLSQIEAKRTVVLTLVSQVAEAYIQLREFDTQMEVAEKAWKARENSLRINKLRHQEGLVSKLEVEQSVTEVETALTEVKKIEAAIFQQENLISVLIGESPTCILRGRPLNELTLPICVPTGLPSDLLYRRPDILEAEKNLRATEALIGAARASFFPRISLTGLFGKVSDSLKDLFSSNGLAYFLSLSAAQEIIDGGLKDFQLLEACSLNKQAMYDYKSKILNGLREVNDALIAHDSSKELLEIAKREVKAYEEYYRLAHLQYENGMVDYLNVLYAKNNLFASELRFAARKGDTFKTLIHLYKALGGGWVIDANNISQEMCY